MVAEAAKVVEPITPSATPVKTETPAKANKTKKVAVVVKKEESSDSDSSSSSDEEEEAKPAVKDNKAKKEAVAPVAAKKEESSDSDSSSSDEEEEAKPAVKDVKMTEASEDESSSSDSDSSDDEEETAKPAVVAAKKSEEAKEAESSSSDESSSDDSSSEDEAETAKPEVAKKENKRPAENIEAPKESNKKQKTADASSNGESDTVFIGNLSWDVTEEQLAEAFAECGEVTSARIITDKQTGKPKGFGYVTFTETSATHQAIEKSGMDLGGREIRVDISTPKPAKQDGGRGRVEKPTSAPSNILFMGNLSFNVTEEELRAEFEKYGDISRIHFPTDRETGEFKGFGYLEYLNVEMAKNAVEALNGHNFASRAIRLDYSQPRENNAGGGRGGARGGNRGGNRGGRGGNRGGNRGGSRGGNFGGRGKKTVFE